MIARGARVTLDGKDATVLEVGADGRALVVLADHEDVPPSQHEAILLIAARVDLSALRVPLDLAEMARETRADMAEIREDGAELVAEVDARLAALATSGARSVLPSDWLEVVATVVDAAASLVPAARALPLVGRARELVHGLANAIEAIRRAAP